MTQRAITSVERMRNDFRGGGFKTWDMSEAVGAHDVDPFILVTLFEMSAPTFPPHPHAGFAVATYILPESRIGFVNQDSIGTRNRIEPGAIHLTVAGRGAVHEEQPERSGGVARGLQIWIDIANDRRDVDPAARSLAAAAVPIVAAGGAEIRVLAGHSEGFVSPLAFPTPLRILDVVLDAGRDYVQTLEDGENAFVIVHDGALDVDGREIATGQLIRFSNVGDMLTLRGGARRARFTLFGGHPLRQPRLIGGPMVAADEAGLTRYRRDYEAGKFGSVTPFSQAG